MAPQHQTLSEQKSTSGPSFLSLLKKNADMVKNLSHAWKQGCLESGGCGHGPRVPPVSCFSGFGEKLNRSCTARFSTTFRTYRIVPHLLPYRSGRIRSPLFVGLTRPGGWYAKALSVFHNATIVTRSGSLTAAACPAVENRLLGGEWLSVVPHQVIFQENEEDSSIVVCSVLSYHRLRPPTRPSTRLDFVAAVLPQEGTLFLINTITTTTALHQHSTENEKRCD